MANYASYKKITTDRVDPLPSSKLAPGAGTANCVVWIYNNRGLTRQNCANGGGCICQACGVSCTWTVPDNVHTVTFEIWSGGGGGAGVSCCNCCWHGQPGAGGNYAMKTLNVTPGDQYVICAGGSWRCSKSHACLAVQGCDSYITGPGLSNFCAQGGCGGCMHGGSWGPRVNNGGCGNCGCCGCGFHGADFGVMGTVGQMSGGSGCHCNGRTGYNGMAPFIGTTMANYTTEAWCSCGCYITWPAGGGTTGQSSYCGSAAQCCAGGSGQGGSGIVKITLQ